MDVNQLYLGIDYGGNGVKMGLVDGEGNLAHSHTRPSVHLTEMEACRAFATEILDFVHEAGIYTSELGGVGLAIPGIVEEGFLTPNVDTDWPLFIEALERTLAQPSIAMLNDANAAAVGELWMGATERKQSVLLVTLGSGIGSGLVIDGHVVSGVHGAAGEIGHMTVVPDGRPCSCGRRGCLERYASARGLVQSFNEAASVPELAPDQLGAYEVRSETDAETVFQAARESDPRALYALDIMASKLGYALAQVACVIDPAVIVLGGGLVASADQFFDELQRVFVTASFPSCREVKIKLATLGETAGVIGAARYAMLQAEQQVLLAGINGS